MYATHTYTSCHERSNLCVVCAQSAERFLGELIAKLRQPGDEALHRVADGLETKAGVFQGDMAGDTGLGSRVLPHARLVYMYNLVFGDPLTLDVLAVVARHGQPGRTRVVMHTDIMAAYPKILDVFEVLTIKKRYTLEEKLRIADAGGGGVGGQGRIRADGFHGSGTLLGSLVVLRLKRRLAPAGSLL